MEITCPASESVAPEMAAVGHVRLARCSILLLEATGASEVTAYVDGLRRQGVRDDYEIIVAGGPAELGDLSVLASLPQVRVVPTPLRSQAESFDACAAASQGEYLLLVRGFINLDLAILEESIRELEDSRSELSVSSTGRFILVHRKLYQACGGFRALIRSLGSEEKPPEPVIPSSSHLVRDLNNNGLSFASGPNTVIDPNVVIDTPQRVRIGANCAIRGGVVLRPEGGEIVIGDNCVINHYCVFHGKGGIYIGDWTIVAPHCGFYAQNHTFESFDLPITKQPNFGKGIYLMGDNWIGGGAVTCDDVTLGKGAVVGANSTVTRSIPMACVAVGSPARVIKRRYREDWDFCQRERAVLEGMPAEIDQYVRERGGQIAALVDAKDRVLDVGCGEGLITHLIADRGAQTTGCDYCQEAVEAAARRYPGIEFVYSNATSLRFPEDSFTKVVLSEVAEHLLPVQFARTVHEAYRVLQPGGTLILSTPLTGKGAHTSTYAHIYEYSEQEMNILLGRVFGPARLHDGKFGILTAQKRL